MIVEFYNINDLDHSLHKTVYDFRIRKGIVYCRDGEDKIVIPAFECASSVCSDAKNTEIIEECITLASKNVVDKIKEHKMATVNLIEKQKSIYNDFCILCAYNEMQNAAYGQREIICWQIACVALVPYSDNFEILKYEDVIPQFGIFTSKEQREKEMIKYQKCKEEGILK